MSVVCNRPCISEETLVRKCFSQYQVIWNTLMCINMMDLSIIKPVIFSWKKVSISIEKKCKNNFHKMCPSNCKEGRRNSYVLMLYNYFVITTATFFLLSS